MADAAGTTVWRWDQAEPFGNNPADEDPDANSVAFDLPLRLPGQRYDQETGLHHNYFRDYDPSLGRYGESDPIGLKGGVNTYAYAYSSPVDREDPYGLFVPPPVVVVVAEKVITVGTAVAAAAAAAAAAVVSGDTPQKEAANDPQTGGGDDCPPECKRLRDQLDAMYQKILKMQVSLDPFMRSRANDLGRQFRNLVRIYNAKCRPPYTKDPFISSVKPTPSQDVIDDFYGR